MSELLIKPGIRLGSYPQRLDAGLDDIEQVVKGWFDRQWVRLQRNRYSQRYIVRKVAHYAETLQKCTDEALDEVLQELRSQLHRRGPRGVAHYRGFCRHPRGRLEGPRQKAFRRPALRRMVNDEWHARRDADW